VNINAPTPQQVSFLEPRVAQKYCPAVQQRFCAVNELICTDVRSHRIRLI
jgi:hypothetical protein